ncbi:MAG TPA: hypothetical protein VKM55_14480 [Candidatus Lokiarchaeia archaeon]|nr:hypothetical protein [Candidatus Lokiarchaeia archaeon]
MPEIITYANLGRATKIIQYPYLTSIIVLVIQIFVTMSFLNYVSIGFMILYWVFILYLAFLFKTMATSTGSKSLASAWICIMLGAIGGIVTIVIGLLLPTTPYMDSVLSIIASSGQDPTVLLANLAPVIISLMEVLLLYVPAQFIVPAVFSYAGWKRVENYVLRIEDVRKRAVQDAMYKLFLSFSANFITGLCLAAVLVSIIGLFELVGTSSVLLLGVLILIAGIIAIVAAIVAFFCTALGYNGTGEAFKLIDEGATVERNGVVSGISKMIRCKSCGNPLPEDPGITYCPICGAFIDDAARKALDD